MRGLEASGERPTRATLGRGGPGRGRGRTVVFLLAAGGLGGAVAGLGATAPVGERLWLFQCLYLSAFLLLAFMLRSFPDHWPEHRRIILIFAVAIIYRMVFHAFSADSEGSFSGPRLPAMLPLRSWALIRNPTIFHNGLLVLFDLLVVAALVRLLRLLKLPLSRTLIYAANPLVLMQAAGSGPASALAVALLLTALVEFERGRDPIGFFALGAAGIGACPIAALLPFMITRDNWRKSFWALVPLLTLAAAAAGFHHQFGSIGLPISGAAPFAADSLPVLPQTSLGSGVRTFGFILLAGCLGIIFLTVHTRVRSAYLALGSVLVLIGPPAPQALTLIIPFLACYPSRAWWFLVAALPGSELIIAQLHQAGAPPDRFLQHVLCYGPFLALLLIDALRPARTPGAVRFDPVATVSVIVPTLNEADQIPELLNNLAQLVDADRVSEVIVVDADSTDGTAGLAQQLGARVIRSERGRGRQIARGIAGATGDVILIVHADCRLKPDAVGRIRHRLNQQPELVGGALGMSYRSGGPRLRLLAALNNARSRWLGIAFGDQGQFFRRHALAHIQGYPAQMLMEDVELSFRMKENGPACHLADGIQVSGRRWRQRGFAGNACKVLALLSLYLVQRRLAWPLLSDRAYYQRYY